MKPRPVVWLHALNHESRTYPTCHFVRARHGSDNATIGEAYHTRLFVVWNGSVFDFQIVPEVCGL